MPATNRYLAERMREAAALLESQGANIFRIGVYRRAADTVAHLDRPVEEIWRAEGLEGLDALPGIGRSLAASVAEMLCTGQWAQLNRLRGAADPESLFQMVPGIGSVLAGRIRDALPVANLEGLEAAAHDGRLAALPGVGYRRASAIAASLDAMLARDRPLPTLPADEPDVSTLLDVDEEYRRKAAAERLPKIAPRRFNPDGEAWLPILHTDRPLWHFTVLFSNTARSHELGRTRDWVVVYFDDGKSSEGQRTVVTETRGRLLGRRVVRGREAECRAHYMGAT